MILRGPAAELPQWQRAALDRFRPDLSLYAIPNAETALPEPLAQRHAEKNVRAWICRGTGCLPPVDDLEAFGKLLSA